ncbi:unnamed protein product [Timema podura]|uniref:NAD(P)-binding domain-containing protein n=2 Tax=Timema TaxID=61471 RepID=A0A7R9PM80_TIMGE|nr:unnamed protein product [Timema genevievae]CAG2053124.1 unnamed protein product [Timema podura]
MKQIAIFGATGQVGLWATRKALALGLSVRVLLREPTRLPEELRSKVDVKQGDVTKLEDVQATVEGVDAVLVALGTRNDISASTTMSEGMRNIITAMKSCGVDIVSVCLSAFLFYDLETVPPMFRHVTADHQRMLDSIKGSGMKWIAVLPPHFTNSPSSKYTVKEGSSPGRTITTQDLGQFLVESLSLPQYYNKVLGIATDVE